MCVSTTDRYDLRLFKKLLPKIEDLCRSAFSEIGCHGWEHVTRVRRLAQVIGAREGASLHVVDVAALFHDTMRLDDDHAQRSAEFAATTLSTMGFSRPFIEGVSEAICSHSFSGKRAARSIEAKVLTDADRLDAMGAIGIYRTVQYNLENGYTAERVVQHVEEKLLKLEPLLHTETARAMARKRSETLRLYLEALEEELLEARSSK
jgi:uncharacterized protein